MKRIHGVGFLVLAALLAGCGARMEPELPALAEGWSGPVKLKIPGSGETDQWKYGELGDNIVVIKEGGLLNQMVGEKTYLDALKKHLVNDNQFAGASFVHGESFTSAGGIKWYSMNVSVSGQFDQVYWTSKMGNRKFSIIHTTGAGSPTARQEKEDVRAFLEAIKFRKSG